MEDATLHLEISLKRNGSNELTDKKIQGRHFSQNNTRYAVGMLNFYSMSVTTLKIT